MHTLKFVILCFIAMTLTGCSVIRPPITDPTACPRLKSSGEETCSSEVDPISACSAEGQLVAAAKSIEKSLHTLAAAQEAESPPILRTAPLVTPEGGMGNTADIDWTGPLAPLLDKIARMTDYRVKILGNEPAIPIMVTITAKRAVIAEILQNASFQAGRRAHIVVYPSTRVIELRYLS